MQTTLKIGAFLLLATMAAYGQARLDGVIDIHAHTAPDSTARSIDAIDRAKLAKQRGMRGLVLKNHYESTAALAYVVRKEVPGIEVFGGIDLNRSVGGINPAAVGRMILMQGGWGRVVWMPTFDAENQVRFSKEDRPFVAVAKDAMSPPVRMTIPQMQEAAHEGAYIEFVYSALLGPNGLKIKDYVEAIRTLGARSCILSSDLGQPGNPLHPDGLAAFFEALRKEGLSDADIDLMSKTNPARALGLE